MLVITNVKRMVGWVSSGNTGASACCYFIIGLLENTKVYPQERRMGSGDGRLIGALRRGIHENLLFVNYIHNWSENVYGPPYSAQPVGLQ